MGSYYLASILPRTSSWPTHSPSRWQQVHPSRQYVPATNPLHRTDSGCHHHVHRHFAPACDPLLHADSGATITARLALTESICKLSFYVHMQHRWFSYFITKANPQLALSFTTDKNWADGVIGEPAQGRGNAQCALCEGGGLLAMHEDDRHFSVTPLGSDWLCSPGSNGFLQTNLQPLGGPTDSRFLHSWPVSYSTIDHDDNSSK